MSALHVDARGLSCPEPVLRAKEAIAGMGDEGVEVLVDSPAPCENIARMARTLGCEVSCEKTAAGETLLRIRKS